MRYTALREARHSQSSCLVCSRLSEDTGKITTCKIDVCHVADSNVDIELIIDLLGRFFSIDVCSISALMIFNFM